jgi:hypothetical protein
MPSHAAQSDRPPQASKNWSRQEKSQCNCELRPGRRGETFPDAGNVDPTKYNGHEEPRHRRLGEKC